jgi:glycosyltransferase involved in cell wall biosynthesis
VADTWTVLAPEAHQPNPPEASGRPTFSVIVAAHDVADVIGDALASLESQTVAPLEVIVCDDGSTDDLDRALEPFAEDIVLVRKSHGGEASAKNAAARAARGDFLLILDADDVYLPRRLEALGDLARLRADLDVLTTDAYLVVGDRRVRRVYDGGWEFETVDQARAILQRNFVFGLAAVRRERFREHGGFDEAIRWTTDWDLWLRMILDGSQVGAVAEPLALYRLREGSLTARRKDLALGKIMTLEKAARNPALGSAHRAVLGESLHFYESQLAALDLDAAVLAADPGVRRRAFSVLFARHSPRSARKTALAAVASPSLARRFLRRRAETSWVGAGGIRVSREREGETRA